MGDRRWFVNRQGKTLVIIPPPGEFVMGSPPNEVGREGGPEGGVEMQRHVRIDHAFAVMVHQVTVAEVLEFRKDFFYRKYFSPESGCPINNITWYDAVAYCNWLNEREGHPEGPMVLPAERPGRVCPGDEDRGRLSPPDRLPPADRGGVGIRLSCRLHDQSVLRPEPGPGQSLCLDRTELPGPPDRLGRPFQAERSGPLRHAGQHPGLVPQRVSRSFRASPVKPGDGRAAPEIVSDRQSRALRSPTLAHCPETVRAAFFDAYAPNVQIYGVGLRVSRTYRPDEAPANGREVTNADRQALEGSTPIEPSEGIRSSVRLRFSPNLGLFAFGFRPARTVE